PAHLRHGALDQTVDGRIIGKIENNRGGLAGPATELWHEFLQIGFARVTSDDVRPGLHEPYGERATHAFGRRAANDDPLIFHVLHGPHPSVHADYEEAYA